MSVRGVIDLAGQSLMNVRRFDHEGLCQLQFTSYIHQRLSCYVSARKSITPLICSVAMSLYDDIKDECDGNMLE